MAQNNADYGAIFIVRNADNTAYDLTGASLEMQVKNKPGATAAATFSTGNGLLVISSPTTNGIVALGVPFGTMAALTPGLYYWDLLRLVNSTSRVRLGTGTFRVTPGVTESATVSLPSSTPMFGSSGNSDIVLIAEDDSLTLTLLPSGPAGPAGMAIIDSAGPPPTSANFQFYRDTNDGWLKVVTSAGNVFQLYPT